MYKRQVEVVVVVVEVGTTTVGSSPCGLTLGTQSMSHNETRLVKMGRTSRVPCCFEVFMMKSLLSLWEPRIFNLISSQINLVAGMFRQRIYSSFSVKLIVEECIHTGLHDLSTYIRKHSAILSFPC